MSGFEVAGIILAAFPIIVTGLEHYKRGFEPLEEWWQFRTSFIEFLDDVEHQLMRYTQNLTRLLDPIIDDVTELRTLIGDPNSSRWVDGSLDQALDIRLGSERSRWLRILSRMEEILASLRKLLKIETSGWVDINGPGRVYHLTRLRIAFSRGKHKKVSKLSKLNQELDDILSYTDTVVPIAEARVTSRPLIAFDGIRKQLCAIHLVLKSSWTCLCRATTSHQVHVPIKLWSEMVPEDVTDLIILTNVQQDQGKVFRVKLNTEPRKETISQKGTADLPHVQRSKELTEMQRKLELRAVRQEGDKKASNSRNLFSLKKVSQQAVQQVAEVSQRQPQITVTTPSAVLSAEVCQRSIDKPKIVNLCSAMAQPVILGHLIDEYDRAFGISGSLVHSVPRDKPVMCSLADRLGAMESGHCHLSRQERFEIAARAASAILDMQVSPWLAAEWSASDIYIPTNSLAMEPKPFLKHDFSSVNTLPSMPDKRWEDWTEEDTRQSLFNLGIVILELIFAKPLAACPSRDLYMGPNGSPGDQTDRNTARKWSQYVLPECGVVLADVVRRCLDCSFGPRPDIREKHFRQAVYQGVVQPLQDYTETWSISR